MARFEFLAHSYRSRIYLVDTRRSWDNLLASYGYCDAYQPGVSLVQRLPIRGRAQVLVICLDTRGLTAAQRAGQCAHEATHVVRDITREVGESFLGDEAEAYFVEALTAWLYEKVSR